MSTLNPYLTFNGNCQEAMTFYQDVFGGDLTLQSVQGFPVEARCPTGEMHQIMHAQLIQNGMILMGTDMIGPGGFQPGNTMSLALQCSTEEDIKQYFSGLSEGGQVLHPLAPQPWAALFAVLIDKYGVAWMLNYQGASAS